MKNESPKTGYNKKTITKHLDDLIVEGINITRAAKKDSVKLSSMKPIDFIYSVHRRYSFWIVSLKELLNKKEINDKIDIGFLYQGDSVPDFLGGLEYGDAHSEKCEKLIEYIRIETSKKIDLLRKVESKLINDNKAEELVTLPIKKELKNISVPLRTGHLIINQDTGGVKLKKINENINPISEEFKILLKLARNLNKQCKYEELINGNVTVDSKRALTFRIRNLKKILGILPAKKRKNKDFFKNIKGFGYRLV